MKPTPAQAGWVYLVGAGPGGLTAAYYLAKKGHAVTVFDALPAAGGMARYGIPSYRVPLDVIDQEVGEVEKLGVEFRFNTRIENVDDLKAQGFDATFLAIGAQSGDGLGGEFLMHRLRIYHGPKENSLKMKSTGYWE